jgi:hypothetical protein
MKNPILNLQGCIPAVALVTTLTITPGGQFYSRELEPKVKLALSHSLSEAITLSINGGVGWHYTTPTSQEDWGGKLYRGYLFTSSLGIDIVDNLTGFLEAGAETDNDEKPILSYGAGLHYTIRENLKLDGAFGFADNNSMLAFVGVSWRIPK